MPIASGFQSTAGQVRTWPAFFIEAAAVQRKTFAEKKTPPLMQPGNLPEVKIEDRLSPKELAAKFGLSEDSAHRWRDAGYIPDAMILYCGTRRMLFHPATVPFLQKQFAAAHD